MTARLPRPVRGVICDMDGTLIDSEAIRHRTFHGAAADIGFPVPEELLARLVGVDRLQNKAMLAAELGHTFPVEGFYAASDARFAAAMADGLPLRPGADALLDALDRLRLPRAIATSTIHDWAIERLRAAGILDRFDAVVGVDDVERPKPAPDPFVVAAARLGLDPEDCLAVEDSPNGARSAVAAGCMTVVVPDLLGPPADIADELAAVFPDLAALARGLAGGWA